MSETVKVKVYKICPQCNGEKYYTENRKFHSDNMVEIPNTPCGECDEFGLVPDGYRDIEVDVLKKYEVIP